MSEPLNPELVAAAERVANELVANQQDLPPDIAQAIKDNFRELQEPI